ncbi:hypothetical protein [Kitasatospora sp. NPDC087315]|uniref:hypothetical protein n=1 Tax=Kitasatospora sp. NPDC087315 TaxID=3364069 RepID=UPI003824758A
MGWTTLWESGTRTLRKVAGTGPTLVCTCVPGRGRPLLGQVCPQRQRACMNERRCQLCGLRIKHRFRAVFVAGAPKGDGPGFVIEPPLHRSCAAYAIQVCPHLITGHRGGDLHVAEVQEYHLLEQRVRPQGRDLSAGLLPQVFAPGDTDAHAFGALDNLVAAPQGPWTPAADWLKHTRTTA